MGGSDDREDKTSTGVPWSEIPEHAREFVEWMEGRHGGARQPLPSLEVVPVPDVMRDLPLLHPDRPRGSKAMLDVHGARCRLAGVRVGAWLISPLTGAKWAKWPCGEVSWVPASVELPLVLRVDCRDDLQ